MEKIRQARRSSKQTHFHLTWVPLSCLAKFTPPRWGDHAAATLPNSRHLVVPGTGHGTLRAGCATRLIGEFFDGADPAALDASCLAGVARPPFWRSATGPVDPKPGTEQ